MSVGELFTIEQVAAKFQMSEAYIHKLIRAGKLRSIKLGHFVRISNEALESFVAENARTGYVAKPRKRNGQGAQLVAEAPRQDTPEAEINRLLQRAHELQLQLERK